MSRLIGIDPGLNVTGYACVEFDAQLGGPMSEPNLIEAGVIRLPSASAAESLAQRLLVLHEDLGAILDELQPSVLVVESIFTHKNYPQTSMLMGHARGVVLLCAEQRGLRTGELAPAEIKRALTGNGRATKQQIQEAVKAQCGLNAIPEPPDVADAIAIALAAARREHVLV